MTRASTLARPLAPPASRRAKVAAPVNWPVSIGKAAAMAGISARMARHYESLNMLSSVNRTGSGYRLYTAADVHTLQFIGRSRGLGFSIDEIQSLLNLWHDQQRTSASVKEIAQKHIDALSERIASMQAMQRSLQQLVYSCHGDSRADCPILDNLAQGEQGDCGSCG